MRAVVQRVRKASVTVADEIVGAIEHGLVVLLGVEQGDQQADLDYLSSKVSGLRIFEDEQGKMNRSVQEVGGAVLVVSQFTLLGDCRKGRRPSFIDAAEPETGNALYESFCERLQELGHEVQRGRFRGEYGCVTHKPGPGDFDTRQPQAILSSPAVVLLILARRMTSGDPRKLAEDRCRLEVRGSLSTRLALSSGRSTAGIHVAVDRG